MVYGVGNQPGGFGLNMNKNSGRRDLRDVYGTTAQINAFDQYLRSRGYSYNQFKRDSWNAKMMAQQQYEIAQQEAGSTIMSNITNIASSIKGLFGL